MKNNRNFYFAKLCALLFIDNTIIVNDSNEHTQYPI